MRMLALGFAGVRGGDVSTTCNIVHLYEIIILNLIIELTSLHTSHKVKYPIMYS